MSNQILYNNNQMKDKSYTAAIQPKKTDSSSFERMKTRSQNQTILKSTQHLADQRRRTINNPLGKRQLNGQRKAEQRKTQPRKGIQKYSNKATAKKNIYKIQSSNIPSTKSSQFKICLDNTQNIFYQNSPNVQILQLIRDVKPFLVMLFLILGLSYISIGKIAPYPSDLCPKNAVCSVFINCNKGYILNDTKCITDPEVIQKAKSISIQLIKKLSYTHGNNECLGQDQIQPINVHFKDIIAGLNNQDSILADQLYYFLVNRENQQQYAFKFSSYTLTPTQKQYSLLCSAQIFVLSDSFKYYVLGSVLLGWSLVALYKDKIEDDRAKKVYQLLKKKTFQSNQFSVDSSKRQGERLYGNWTKDLWEKVDRKRVQDGCISFYELDQKIYWKRIN